MLWTMLRHMTRTTVGTTVTEASHELPAMGVASFHAGDFAVACRHLRAARAADPADGDVLYYLALAEARGGRHVLAEELLQELRLTRDDADVNNALGNVCRMRGRMNDAGAAYQRALAIDGGHLAALANLGLVLRDQGVPQEALPLLDRALAIAPDYVEALFNKALVLIDLGERLAADQLIERVLTLDPGFAEAHLQRGFTLLRRGDFAAGWREYGWRVNIPELDHWRDYDYPLWRGEKLSGRRVLVQAEQGLGDQIMFASCLPDILERARQVMIECDPRLAVLFARSFPKAVVYRHRVKGQPGWSREPAPDFRVRLGDLPRMLRNCEADFPRHSGYLIADPGRVANWRIRLAALGSGPKIGLSWRGGTPATGQRARSLPLEDLLPIVSLPDAHFVSLQYGHGREEIANLRTRYGVTLSEWPQAIADMDEMAALVAGLDMVISVCTTAAHLAGALGKTAWVLVPAVAEWRYRESGNGIPWYPELRLFRQRRTAEWSDVILAVRTALTEAIGADLK